ncbi:MAG: hemolysin III family protein [Anaerolineales bacterium]|nr:hemolysin III family protein [Anaerolineales bacterium]
MGYKTDPNAPTTKIGELIANSITHGAGIGLSIAGLVVLIVRAARQGTNWYLIGVIIFGTSLILQYLASTLYHSMANKPWKAALQRLDHSAIFILIAGTYTPFLLTVIRGWLGWILFGVIWGLALVMLILKLALRKRFEKPPVWLYLLMGWLGVLVFWGSWGKINPASLTFLILGGGVYSLGILFYKWRALPYSHSIWHLFVLGGSIFHYFSILFMV